MYLNFYQLQVEPFDITPDPEFLLLNDGYKEALGAITYGIQQRKGFISIVGEVGTGKTTLVHAYLNRRDREKLIAVYIFDPSLSFEELVEECALALGVDVENATPGRKIQRLHWALLNAFKAGKNVALIIDEAQNLPVETLEKLRMLSNFETDKNKLLQLVLVGQPELRTKLNLHELRQLKQRVAMTAEIGPLTYRESLRYIDHRIKIASYGRQPLFTRGAKRLIAKRSEGIPRNINVLADNALIAGYAVGEKPVKRSTVKSVLHDRGRAQNEPWGVVPSFRRAMLASAFVASVGIVGAIYGSTSERNPAGAVETPRVTKVLPEPMAAEEQQPSEEESAEPVSSEDTGPPVQAGPMPGDLTAGDSVNTPTLPPAPAAESAQSADDEPAAVSLDAAPLIELDVIEPERAEVRSEPAVADASEPQSDADASTPAGEAEAPAAGGHEESPAAPIHVDPRAALMAAAKQMVVHHPAIPPFRLSAAGASPAESKTAPPDAPEPGQAPVEARATAGTPAVPQFEPAEEAARAAERKTARMEEPSTTRVWRVRRGEFLWSIAMKNYGYVDDDLMDRIRRANPEISNINLIHPGDRLKLPAADQVRGRWARPQ